MPLISSRLPLLLAVAALLAMVASTSWQGYQFWQAEQNQAAGLATTSAEPRTVSTQAPDINLGEVSLFGDEDQAEVVEEPDIDNLPETNLQLVLRGVMSASGDFPGSALVEDAKRNTEAYIVGEELPGNATLKTVRPDRIVIERSGALESLYFPEDEDRSGMDVAVNDTGSENVNAAQAGYVEQPARPASFGGPESNSASDSRREEIRKRLEQLRNRLRNNN
ncbi:type II secretion system protein N [Marinobacter sp. CHS3-4]|uniref:type II secretion system protein N n=1 Tax=Marinobacter sp. CHS3-4 TaxID=3045174 RepID=UPI0024B5019F|nr:type II secretion system protein N [Marinobacter sp. CHS3-4]MDI9245292.1 type II secretion system protein N [Marinobacter sp. CHS3-4]